MTNAILIYSRREESVDSGRAGGGGVEMIDIELMPPPTSGMSTLTTPLSLEIVGRRVVVETTVGTEDCKVVFRASISPSFFTL